MYKKIVTNMIDDKIDLSEFDVNHDGIINDKDMEILKRRMKK